MQTKYQVSGMTCDHCVAHVTEEVSSIQGVNNVNVDLTSGQMVVDSNDAISFSDIEQAVDEAGDYTVTAAE